jgi:hypothetical protein
MEHHVLALTVCCATLLLLNPKGTYIIEDAEANSTDVNPIRMTAISFWDDVLHLELSSNFTYGRTINIVLSDEDGDCNYPGPYWLKQLELPANENEGRDIFIAMLPLNFAECLLPNL